MNLVFSAFSESLFTANQSEILVNSELIKFETFEILEFPPLCEGADGTSQGGVICVKYKI